MRGTVALRIGLLAACVASGHAAEPGMYRRQVGVRLQHWPLTGAREVLVKVEVPKDYPIIVAPATSLTRDVADTELEFSVNPTADGNTLITFAALSSKPMDLPTYLFTFSFDHSDPESLPVPMRLRYFAVREANLQFSKTAEADIVVQAHPSGVYEPLE